MPKKKKTHPKKWPWCSPTLLEGHSLFNGNENIKYSIRIQHNKSKEFVWMESTLLVLSAQQLYTPQL